MTGQTKRKRVTPDAMTVRMAQISVGMDVADHASEQAVLGAVLQKPDLYPALADVLQAADFAHLTHGFIWHAFEQVLARNDEIDIVTISAELQRLPACPLEGEEALTYLGTLMASAPDIANAEGYALNVHEAALRLRVLEAAAEITTIASNKTLQVAAVVDQCDQLLFEATEQKAQRTTSAYDVMSRFYDHLEAGRDADNPPGVKTGFKSLDGIIKALYPGEVTVMAGAAGMGKTSLALSIAVNVAKMGGRAAYFSLEMSQAEVMRIIMSMETGIHIDTLKSYRFSPGQWQRVVDVMPTIGDMPLHIIDEFATLTPTQLRQKTRRLMLDAPVNLVVIDGLWLMQPDNEHRKRNEAVAEIMRGLTSIASPNGLHVPVLITHQYRRNDRQDKRPVLTDLAESAAVERDSQVILAMHRESYYDLDGYNLDEPTSLYVLKRRNGGGRGESVRLAFNRQHALYQDV
jgi:replicative DNA helicase